MHGPKRKTTTTNKRLQRQTDYCGSFLLRAPFGQYGPVAAFFLSCGCHWPVWPGQSTVSVGRALPGRCILSFICIPQSTRALDQGRVEPHTDYCGSECKLFHAGACSLNSPRLILVDCGSNVCHAWTFLLSLSMWIRASFRALLCTLRRTKICL